MNDAPAAIAPLYAFDVSPDGGARALTEEDLKTPAGDDVAYRWTHLDLAREGVRDWIAQAVDETVASSLSLEDTRPRCARHDDGVLLNLRGVNLNPDSDPEDMVSIRIWFDARSIISARLRRLMAVVGLREAIERGDAPATTGAFVTTLAASLTERMDPVISTLADKVDALEETSLMNAPGTRTTLAELRRTVIILRRYIAPQRDALSRLSQDAKPLLSPEDTDCLRETVDRITRIVEELDAIRERAAILYDQLSDQRAEEMNRNMLLLSIIAAIFLPLGFLTGLLGVNIGGVPGVDFQPAFAIFSVILVLIAGILLWWFRKNRWL